MIESLKDKVSSIQKANQSLSIDDTLSFLAEQFPGKVVFSTSFSFEDQAISHIILSNHLPIKIFTLDTDRKSTRLNSSHPSISYAVFCLKKKTKKKNKKYK